MDDLQNEENVLSPIQPEPDAEALRDERVIPVARGVLQDMAVSMPSVEMNENTEFTSVLVKALTRALDADLNLTTENPYVFQLVLEAFSGFSSMIQKCKTSDSDDACYALIGGELMNLLANASIPMGVKAKQEDKEKAFAALQPQVEAIFAREQLTWLEVKYILEGLLKSFQVTQQLFSGNVERSTHRMEAKILGIEDMSDLSMKKMDETLKAEFPEIANA